MLATLLLAVPLLLQSQQSASSSRAQEIASAFTKHKQMVGEKRGVRKEKYKDVRSEPLVRPDITEYAGVYQVPGSEDVIELRIGNDGGIQARGHDSNQPSRTFVLENAAIDGAVLTAAKVYRDGAREPFEGVFLTRVDRESPKDPGVTTYGLGVVLATPREFAGNTYDKLFYQLQQ
jgi:hypothetical protein